MTELEIFKKCLTLGMTKAGAAGCTANILHESNGRPDNVENTCPMSDEAYTKAVDDGRYTNFVNDGYGYGLCQWTFTARRCSTSGASSSSTSASTIRSRKKMWSNPAGWSPPNVPALWTEVAKPGEIPVWKQPTGAQDVYNTGDRVWYPERDTTMYESIIDNNSWAPDVYGWKVVS